MASGADIKVLFGTGDQLFAVDVPMRTPSPLVSTGSAPVGSTNTVAELVDDLRFDGVAQHVVVECGVAHVQDHVGDGVVVERAQL